MRKVMTIHALALLAIIGMAGVSAAQDSQGPVVAPVPPPPVSTQRAYSPSNEPVEPLLTPMPAPQAGDASHADQVSPSADAGPCRQNCRCGQRCGECGETPFGASVKAAVNVQICNGIGDRMVLYHYHFCGPDPHNAMKLNAVGIARLEELVRMVPCSHFHPIVIERTTAACGDPDAARQACELDAARRAYVLNLLEEWHAALPDQLVVVGRPRTPGLRGEDALIIQDNWRQNTVQWGQDTSGATNVSGGATNASGTSNTPGQGQPSSSQGNAMGGQ